MVVLMVLMLVLFWVWSSKSGLESGAELSGILRPVQRRFLTAGRSPAQATVNAMKSGAGGPRGAYFRPHRRARHRLLSIVSHIEENMERSEILREADGNSNLPRCAVEGVAAKDRPWRCRAGRYRILEPRRVLPPMVKSR